MTYVRSTISYIHMIKFYSTSMFFVSDQLTATRGIQKFDITFNYMISSEFATLQRD